MTDIYWKRRIGQLDGGSTGAGEGVTAVNLGTAETQSINRSDGSRLMINNSVKTSGKGLKGNGHKDKGLKDKGLKTKGPKNKGP